MLGGGGLGRPLDAGQVPHALGVSVMSPAKDGDDDDGDGRGPTSGAPGDKNSAERI